MKKDIRKLVKKEINKISEEFEYQQTKPLNQDKVNNQRLTEGDITIRKVSLTPRLFVDLGYGKNVVFNFMATTGVDLDKLNTDKENIINDIQKLIRTKLGLIVSYNPYVKVAGLSFLLPEYELSQYITKKLK